MMHLLHLCQLQVLTFPLVPGSTLEDILAAARSQPESVAEDVDSEDDSDSSAEAEKAAAGTPPPPVSDMVARWLFPNF